MKARVEVIGSPRNHRNRSLRRRWMAVVAGCLFATGGVALAHEPVAPSPVERGKFLVTMGSCDDCHTPWKLTPQGPAPDMTRRLSGHPASLVMPPAPVLPPGPWVMVAAGTNTAWAGPWGVSFTANLTPDAETGIGQWSESDFIATVRSGRHLGRGRQILPPMPIQTLQQLGDDDLKAIYAFLRTLPPISNKVPDPTPPAAPPAPPPH